MGILLIEGYDYMCFMGIRQVVGRDLSTSLVIKSGPGDFLFFEVEITVEISSSVISGSGS